MKVWYARYPPDDDGAFEMAALVSTTHPDRTVVDVAPSEPLASHGTLLYRSRYGPDGHLRRALVDPGVVAGAPSLWYVALPEPDADPPAMNLVAFGTDDFAAGTVVDLADHQALDLERHSQLAALRWWTGNGQVHQVYVAARARRQGIGTTMVLVGAALALGRRWPSLWGTGDLTDLGAAWIDQALWGSRVQSRTRRLPPMTPPGETVGVPVRNLEPDPPPDIQAT